MSTDQRMTDDQLLRLACIYAEEERRRFIWEHDQSEVMRPQVDRAREYADQLHEYRVKRWGETWADRVASASRWANSQ